jgi:uncharacterized damage-inducible protein DinB
MSLVDEALAVWAATRQGVISEVELVPDDQLDFRVNPAARSIREIATHVAAHGIGFTNELLADETNFGSLFQPNVVDAIRAKLPKAEAKSDVIALLRTTGEQCRARLKERGERLITETQKSQLSPTGSMSRLSGLWFAIGHESHHRGQLTAYLRADGIVPALTQQLMAQQHRK